MTFDYSDAYGLDDDTDEGTCQTCGGDGIEECESTLDCWERDCTDGIHTCPNCGGSGRAKDQTWW